MTELNQKVAEYVRMLDGITYPEWKQLSSVINFAFGEKKRKLHYDMELAAEGEVIVGDEFTLHKGYIPNLWPQE